MADQVGSGTMSGAADTPAEFGPDAPDRAHAGVLTTPGEHPHFSGRPVSWVAVVVIIVGFTLGGIALIAGPAWWLFWTALGVTVVGGILAISTGIFNDWY